MRDLLSLSELVDASAGTETVALALSVTVGVGGMEVNRRLDWNVAVGVNESNVPVALRPSETPWLGAIVVPLTVMFCDVGAAVVDSATLANAVPLKNLLACNPEVLGAYHQRVVTPTGKV